jgi:hypothetical protein
VATLVEETREATDEEAEARVAALADVVEQEKESLVRMWPATNG